MTDSNRWLLPDGIEEVLPPLAWRMEILRRNLLDLYRSWGYELVIPPFIEYLESLLTGMGSDLDLQTFKVTDQLTGRMMGIRADMTPQVARIDAHSLNREGAVRLCYGGSILHTRAPNQLSSRCPLQMGAELYGCAGLAADIEIINLMLESLKITGATKIHLDLGHVGIYRSLVAQAGLSTAQETELFSKLQRKSNAEVHAFVAEHVENKSIADILAGLTDLNGDISVLTQAANQFKDAPPQAVAALKTLTSLAQSIQESHPEVALYFDLAELRGYQYHTGIAFTAYLPGIGQAVAKGGRYDDIGEVFGRARPATGFSTDLKLLLGRVKQESLENFAIMAPNSNDPALQQTIKKLRASGEVVICQLKAEELQEHQTSHQRRLVNKKGQWQVETL